MSPNTPAAATATTGGVAVVRLRRVYNADTGRTRVIVNPPMLVLVLPEPPSLNEMIRLAKQRTRRSRTGGWMRRSLPVVYDQALEAYELAAVAMLRTQGVKPPREPWAQWRITAIAFRLHSLRDPVELRASLKWPVDLLVRQGYVADDGPRELVSVCEPEQCIDRANRGVTITVEEYCAA